MLEDWVRPTFQHLDVSGECTAYSGVGYVAGMTSAGAEQEKQLVSALHNSASTQRHDERANSFDGCQS